MREKNTYGTTTELQWISKIALRQGSPAPSAEKSKETRPNTGSYQIIRKLIFQKARFWDRL